MAKKKIRKFAEGGYETTEGMNPNIDDDVRSRAMKFVQNASEESRDINPPVTKSVTKVAVTKPQSDWDSNSKIPAMPDVPRKVETPNEYKTRMDTLTKKQALETVEPENYIPGTGMIKGLIKQGMKNLLKKGLKTYTAEQMEAMTPKLGREALKLGREYPKLGMKKGGSVKKMSSGGKVKSASSRADGCAIRGKTRA